MGEIYKVSAHIVKDHMEVNLAVEILTEGIAEAISLAVQYYKRMGAEEVDIYEAERIHEFN